jgi:protein-S-isoprenylcysteine O-methyltransferase Ste14
MARTLSLIVRNLAFTVVMPGLGPMVVLTRDGGTAALEAWEAVPLIAAGMALYAWSVWKFAAVGGGTPGLWDAPSRVVVAGPYRWVRNPIYIAALLVVLGKTWLFGSLPLLAYAGIIAVFFHLFVASHEEPALGRRFGSIHADYRRAVSRRVPHRPRRALTDRHPCQQEWRGPANIARRPTFVGSGNATARRDRSIT